MPRHDGEGPVVALDMFELTAPLYGLFGGGIDAAGVLAEVEGGFMHYYANYSNAINNPTANATIAPPKTKKSHLLDFPPFFD